MSRSNRRPKVSLLVTDLDNTLYDWFAMWHPSFSAMVQNVSASSGVPQRVLLDEIRQVHQKRGTSEYSYLLNELPSLIRLHPGENISVVYNEAIRQYRSIRKQKMTLYPGVRDALLYVKQLGVPIVAYTESLAYYSAWRIRELDLDGVIDYLYSPPDHGFPDGVTPQMLRTRPSESYSFKVTEHHHTPTGVLKPDPHVLQDILEEMRVPASRTLYVGDSLMKDVAMAQDVGAIDALAAYGVVQDRHEYNLLRAVSHWTDRDVERERQIALRAHIAPTYTLHRLGVKR